MAKEVWLFDSGNYFIGNSKALFLYVNDYHKEIETYYFSNNQEVIKKVRGLGFKAYSYNSRLGKKIMSKATTYIVDENKDIPSELMNCKILNLGNGVGIRKIENEITSINEREAIVKKYIKNNAIYNSNQLYLVTSEYHQNNLQKAYNLSRDTLKEVGGGYPRNLYHNVSTYNHDLIKRFDENTKVILYAPTSRQETDSFFSKAFPNLDELLEVCKENNLIIIFKMHPLMQQDISYQFAKEKYKDNPHFLFWSNENDIYEILDKIDLAIVDYSSIFYDLIFNNIKKFIRYTFDYDQNLFIDDYYDMTCGKKCKNYDELLMTLKNIDTIEIETKKLEHLKELFWSYSKKYSLEDIITKTLSFKIEQNKKKKTLYSFDIFDTLITRRAYEPKAIFYYVKAKIQTSNLFSNSNIINDFPRIRFESERDVRNRKKKDLNCIATKEYEITLEEIYNRIARIYNLNNKQKEILMNWEIEAELANVVPINEMINKALTLKSEGNDVVLISDMYLPEKIIKEMLAKANHELVKLPLFLSSSKKVQKTSKELFIRTYQELNYSYEEWNHYGDNYYSDSDMPKELGIKTTIQRDKYFNSYEKEIFSRINTYDSYLVANILRKNRLLIDTNSKDYFSYSFVSLYFVPYVNWALKDAVKNGYKCLYFISRDGYYLKIIADELIKMKKYPIKTKYIYGSRRAWRIPSYIDNVDEEFFSVFGNISNTIQDFNELLTSLWLSEEEFDDCFHELEYVKKAKYDVALIQSIIPIIKASDKYRHLILEKAKKERIIVLDYLKQEINFQEKFAFVEFWGRGYTQKALHRLLKCIDKKYEDTIFYYSRSIYEDEEHIIRKNFTSNQNIPIFIEAIFANSDINSVIKYERKDNHVVPVITKNIHCDKNLFQSIEKNIITFCHDFYDNDYLDEEALGRSLYEFSLDYYMNNSTNKQFCKNIGPLFYTEGSYDEVHEFAPKLNIKNLFQIIFSSKEELDKNIDVKTRNLDMSIKRSSRIIRKVYEWKKNEYFKNLFKKITNIIKRIIKKIISLITRKKVI